MGTPSAEELRLAMRSLASGVVMVTTRVDGVDYSMTANSFASVCLDPALVMLSVERDTQFHDAVIESGVWGVSVLAAEHGPLALDMARRGRPPGEQLAGIDVRRGPAGLALLADGLAGFECRTEQAVRGGDHDVLLGAVTHCDVANDLRSPLVYWSREFTSLHQGS